MGLGEGTPEAKRGIVRPSLLAWGGVVVLAVVLWGGYGHPWPWNLGDWRWTGFTGNTLWKWMQLLFLPLLVPTVILPAFQPMAMRQVVYLDEHGNPIAPPSPADDKPAEPVSDTRPAEAVSRAPAAEPVSGAPRAEATPERPVRL